MDTAKLELAAQRYREAEQALEAAHTDLQAEAVAALQQPDAQAAVVHITGWTPEYLRGLLKGAEGEGA
ncbi:hypothetical protein [Streptomyces sp. NPDC006645]|uniref:hypothetical protein n=1 Tax=unclassified Streptomyces TaxID=2593676 RepID=UPI0033A33788